MDEYEFLVIAIPIVGAIATAIIAYFVESGLKRKFILVEKLWDEKYNGLKELSVCLETLRDLLGEIQYLDYGSAMFGESEDYVARKVAETMTVEYGFPEEQSPLMSHIGYSSLSSEDQKKELDKVRINCYKRIDHRFMENAKKARTLTRELSLLMGDRRIIDISNDVISKIRAAKFQMVNNYNFIDPEEGGLIEANMVRLTELANQELRWTRFEGRETFWRRNSKVKSKI